MIDLIVIHGKKVDTDYAKRLSIQFETEIAYDIPDNNKRYFLMDKSGISFVNGEKAIRGDFTRMLPRITNGHIQHEILLKVAKQDSKDTEVLRAVDATAGLGEDAFILAAGGYNVEMFEHNPITAVLLKDALVRAKNNALTKDIASRMSFKQGDSKDLLLTLNYIPDIIYLDPMFPEKKKSSESKMKLQVLHTIESTCEDEEELLKKAIGTHPKRIIIKRPPKGPFLCGIKPTFSVERKAVRFDCIVL